VLLEGLFVFLREVKFKKQTAPGEPMVSFPSMGVRFPPPPLL